MYYITSSIVPSSILRAAIHVRRYESSWLVLLEQQEALL
jgi:hypothetical protein